MSGPLHRVVQDLDDLVGQIEAWACPDHDSGIEAEQGLGLRCRGRRALCSAAGTWALR